MRRAVTLAIIASVIGLAFYFTKPADDFLREEAYKHVVSELNPKIGNETVLPDAFNYLFREKISIEDKFFYKRVMFELGDKKMVAGYGVFNVFTARSLREQ